jgi:hypothetical protein
MPSFGHDVSHVGIQKAEGYGDTDAWVWQQPPHPHHPPYQTQFDPPTYTNFAPRLQPPASRAVPGHSLATFHGPSNATAASAPSRPHAPPNMVKAQPVFKPTWQGFLDTTKDAMTVIEAALQGRLNHISRRPHDKERAEMLTSGTVLVYEENASGIKRWTDAVHWSPSRVMNNCLIYRQLVRALKPEEKKMALNPSCGTKRKRKESTAHAVIKNGDREIQVLSDDEYDCPSFDGAPIGDAESANKVYANYAQSLTPDQQRRFCGSLIDSYEFKEGGLMKKTISVKYQGTHHHVISYYSLEDVVSGKLKRPFQDSKLAHIHPRPELLQGWKVSLEDEESKDMPLITGYSQPMQSGHLPPHVVDTVPRAIGEPQAAGPNHAPLQLRVQEYWHGPQIAQYTTTNQTSQHYASPQSAAPPYSTSNMAHQYTVQQSVPQAYDPHQPSSQQYAQPSPPQHYPTTQSSSPQYSTQTTAVQHYTSQPEPTRHYELDRPQPASTSPYSHLTSGQYSSTHSPQTIQPTLYAASHATPFDSHVTARQSSTTSQQSNQTIPLQADLQRRASAPVPIHAYRLNAPPHPHSYYVADAKYTPTLNQAY